MSTPEDYVAPESVDLGEKAPEAKAPAKPAGKAKPTPAVTEAPEVSYEQGQPVIGIGKLVNAKGTAVTEIMIQRIETHMNYVAGRKGFKDKEEEVLEMAGFIETIGNSLKLPYEQFVLVTDAVLQAVQENQKAFTSGTAYRFTQGLDKRYPPDSIHNYRVYMTFLTKVAVNWKSRWKLAKLISLAFVIQDFDQKAKENITQYFRYLTNV
jgi:hypothetical protein